MIDETDDTDDDFSDSRSEWTRLRPQPDLDGLSSLRSSQQGGKTISSARSSEVGDTQAMRLPSPLLIGTWFPSKTLRISKDRRKWYFSLVWSLMSLRLSAVKNYSILKYSAAKIQDLAISLIKK